MFIWVNLITRLRRNKYLNLSIKKNPYLIEKNKREILGLGKKIN